MFCPTTAVPEAEIPVALRGAMVRRELTSRLHTKLASTPISQHDQGWVVYVHARPASRETLIRGVVSLRLAIDFSSPETLS